jgi:hypothetical protein
MSKTHQPLTEAQLQLRLRRLTDIYRQNVNDSDAAKAWLKARGFDDFTLFERYSLGWSAGDLPRKLSNDPAVRSQFIEVGILDAKGVERFAGHVIFSIFGLDGRYQNLWACSADGEACFLPNRSVGPWNVTVVKHSPHLYLAPDPVNALSLISAGYANVVALHAKLGVLDLAGFKNHGLQRITVVTGDTPEEQATVQALLAKLTDCACDVAVLPGSAGANDFLCRHGAKALAEAVMAATNGLQSVAIPNFIPKADGFSLRVDYREYDGLGLGKSGHQLKLTLRVKCRGKMHVDTFDIYAARPRKEFIREAARIFEEQPRLFEEDMARLISACELRVAQPDLALPDQTVDPVPEALRKEAEIFGRSPELFQLIREHLTTLGIEGEDLNKLAAYIGMTSRLLAEPLAIIFISSYGAGKNAISGRVSKLCPPELLFDVTHLSPKALLHLPADGLKRRFMPIEEMKGAEKADYLLRVLISSGHLVARITSRDPASGRLYTESKRVEGPTAVMVTTSKPFTDEETLSRFIVLGLDESPQQTRRIQEKQREGQGLDGLKKSKDTEKIRLLHHAFQRLLQPLSVIFPDPSLIPECDDRIGSRRDLPKIINLIKAVAFLRQMQKQVKQHDGVNYIEVDAEDMKIASPLIQTMFQAPLRELSVTSRNLLQLLHDMRTASQPAGAADRFTFTLRQAREYTKFSQTTLHRCKVELELFDFLVRDTSSRQRPYRYFLEWAPDLAPFRATA